MTIATVPGTFDPITLGHVSIIERTSTAFDNVLVAVAAGVHKKTLFSLEERVDMVESCFRNNPKIRIAPAKGLLVDFLRENESHVLIRGLRAVSDFELETQLAFVNKKLYPALETMLMMPDQEYTHIHSTLVREIALLKGDIRPFVPGHICDRVVEKLAIQYGDKT